MDLPMKETVHRKIVVELRAEGPTPGQVRSIEYLPVIFLAVAIGFLPIGPDPGSLADLAVVFVSIVLEAIPFMFFGSLAGGLIEAFVSRERMASLLPRRGWLTVCFAAGAGILFPVCECAVVPVVRRLAGKGLPLSAVIGYLLGGPIVNPIVAASTALAYGFDWHIVVIRMALGYGIAVTIGLLMGRWFSGAEAFREGLEPPVSGEAGTASCACGCSHPVPSTAHRITSAFRHALDDFSAVGHYLVIGAFIAATAQTYIDRSSFLSIAGLPVLAIALMMALAILLNLCSEADAFIAASFRNLMPLPAQMAFMLTGPMFDLKLLLMYQAVFQRKAITILAISVLTAVFGVSIGFEWIVRMTI
jgi:hypothetical protein